MQTSNSRLMLQYRPSPSSVKKLRNGAGTVAVGVHHATPVKISRKGRSRSASPLPSLAGSGAHGDLQTQKTRKQTQTRQLGCSPLGPFFIFFYFCFSSFSRQRGCSTMTCKQKQPHKHKKIKSTGSFLQISVICSRICSSDG